MSINVFTFAIQTKTKDMKTVIVNLNNLINIRGQREQAFKFAASKLHGGMKQCYTKGCEIFTPAFHALKGVDVQHELRYERVFFGETSIRIDELQFTK